MVEDGNGRGNLDDFYLEVAKYDSAGTQVTNTMYSKADLVNPSLFDLTIAGNSLTFEKVLPWTYQSGLDYRFRLIVVDKDSKWDCATTVIEN